VDALLDGVLAEEVVDEDGFVLADAVGAVGRLGLGGGVPPRVVVNEREPPERYSRRPSS
jgi:hypothetical protein